MIQKLLLATLLFISLNSCKAQTTYKTITMESYTKKINNLEVKMFVETNIKDRKTSWNIYVYNSKKDSVLIDHFEYPKIYEKEQEYISGDIRKHVIIGDVILEHKTIYLMLYKHGNSYLNTYEFTDNKKFVKNEYFASKLATGTYLNFGHPFYNAEIKFFAEDEIYIKFDGGTEVFSGNGSITLLKFDNFKKKLTKIIFNNLPKITVKDNDKLFETLNINNKEKIGIEIKKNLVESKLIEKEDNFNYVDYIYDRSVEIDLEQINKIKGGIIYFFYQINKMKGIKIIRYDNYENEWLIGNYKEERIKSK